MKMEKASSVWYWAWNVSVETVNKIQSEQVTSCEDKSRKLTFIRFSVIAIAIEITFDFGVLLHGRIYAKDEPQ